MKALMMMAMVVVGLVSNVAMADLNVVCQKLDKRNNLGDTVASFVISGRPSHRLVDDIIETRSATDHEAIPGAFAAQYKYQPEELMVQIDDGGLTGAIDLNLRTFREFFKRRNDTAIARYVGVYERKAAGRELKEIVSCGVFEQ